MNGRLLTDAIKSRKRWRSRAGKTNELLGYFVNPPSTLCAIPHLWWRMMRSVATLTTHLVCLKVLFAFSLIFLSSFRRLLPMDNSTSPRETRPRWSRKDCEFQEEKKLVRFHIPTNVSPLLSRLPLLRVKPPVAARDTRRNPNANTRLSFLPSFFPCLLYLPPARPLLKTRQHPDPKSPNCQPSANSSIRPSARPSHVKQVRTSAGRSSQQRALPSPCRTLIPNRVGGTERGGPPAVWGRE